MSDLVKEGREKLEGVSGAPWYTSDEADISSPEDELLEIAYRPVCMQDLDNADFIVWSRNNMAALLDQLEHKDIDIRIAKMNQETAKKNSEAYDRLKKENKLMADVVEAYKSMEFNVKELLSSVTEGHRADALFELKHDCEALEALNKERK